MLYTKHSILRNLTVSRRVYSKHTINMAVDDNVPCSLFPTLPAEIRNYIWRCSVPDDEPEECLVWPANMYIRFESSCPIRYDHAFVVDTAFPVALHVCRESRAAVLTNPRLRFRESPAACCRVPFRAIRPEFDTMYWGAENLETCAAVQHEIPVMEDVQTLAVKVQWGFRLSHNLLASMTACMLFLRTLSLVLADATDKTGPRTSFKQPARRCKLRRIPPVEADTILIDLRRLQEDVPGEAVSLTRALELVRLQLEINDSQSGRSIKTILTPEYYVFNHIEQFVAETFVEYQPDGTWKESCRERTFVDDGENLWVSKYIPMAERPDPELVRGCQFSACCLWSSNLARR